MVTKKHIQQLAAKAGLEVTYDYNPARSRYEASIGSQHFRSLAECRDYLIIERHLEQSE